jgi:hypothetical protein
MDLSNNLVWTLWGLQRLSHLSQVTQLSQGKAKNSFLLTPIPLLLTSPAASQKSHN